MTRSHPPRLAVALLQRYLPDNEPLAGDLIEGFAVRPSSWWFWREVLAALVIHAFQPSVARRPLGLVGEDDAPAVQYSSASSQRPINLTASPIHGVGGLGLVALGVLVAVVDPDVVWIFLPAIAGGLVLGIAMVFLRRSAILSGRSAHVPSLFRNSADR